MSDLVLHLKKCYFEAIRDGKKTFEYREQTPYWQKRLVGRMYDGIQLQCGYPKAGDKSRIIRRRWQGYEKDSILHKHFGDRPVFVFAIRVNGEDL